MINHLRLRKPIYLKTAAYGHFGRPEFRWEATDAVDELLSKTRRANFNDCQKLSMCKPCLS